jgi:hypothetical protein
MIRACPRATFDVIEPNDSKEPHCSIERLNGLPRVEAEIEREVVTAFNL